MAELDKSKLSEQDICTKFITAAIESAGWDIQTDMRQEVSFTAGRINARGKHHSRGKAKCADYILNRQKVRLAIVEAKKNSLPMGEGMAQSVEYARILDVPFVFTSNGDGFMFRDLTKKEGRLEVQLGLDEFPSPQALLQRYQESEGLTDEAMSIIAKADYHEEPGRAPRYYQNRAIDKTIEAVARGQDRILLVMATG